jgi:hypothetical protein
VIDAMVFIAAPAAGVFGYVAWGLRHERIERETAAVAPAAQPTAAPSTEVRRAA